MTMDATLKDMKDAVSAVRRARQRLTKVRARIVELDAEIVRLKAEAQELETGLRRVDEVLAPYTVQESSLQTIGNGVAGGINTSKELH